MLRILLSLVLVGLVAVAGAAKKAAEDPLDLAALMLRDNHPDRALAVLDGLDPAAGEIDTVRYHTLRGLAAQRLADLPAAKSALAAAVAAGATDAVVFVYLAQISYELGDDRAVIKALSQVEAETARIPSTWHLRADALWRLSRPIDALAALDQARVLFPDDPSFPRRRVFYLIDLGLYQAAADQGEAYLARFDGRFADRVAIADALRRAGQTAKALHFLEAAHLLHPESLAATKALAHVYVDRQAYHTAAALIDEAAVFDRSLVADAAELYRRAGQRYRALLLNGQIADQEAKLKQRLALTLELGHFEQAAAMREDLYRLNLVANEDIRYALAFALFKSGDYPAAENELARLRRGDLFRKAVEVRRAIAECRDEPWRCQ